MATHDDKHQAQCRRIFNALKSKPLTMKEVDVLTGIMRENICRHISTLLELGKIAVIRKRKCSITGYSNVNVYSGNPDLFPKSNQLELF